MGAAFAAHDVSVDMEETAAPDHASDLAQAAVSQGYELVVVAGGDGTLGEVLTGLCGSRMPVAILPQGTGNQVARNLSIPLDLNKAVDIAVHGRPTPVDLGCVGDRHFVLAAGAGYDAAVMLRANRGMKKRWGMLAYVYAVLHEAAVAAPRDFVLVIDGKELRLSALSILIANMGELYLGALPVPLSPRPGRSWQDGLLDVIVVAPASSGDLPGMAWQVMRRRFRQERRLLHFQAKRVAVDAAAEVPVELDGDVSGSTPIDLEVVPGGATVVLPTDGSG